MEHEGEELLVVEKALGGHMAHGDEILDQRARGRRGGRMQLGRCTQGESPTRKERAGATTPALLFARIRPGAWKGCFPSFGCGVFSEVRIHDPG